MKKVISLILAVLMLFSFAACGNNSSSVIGEWENIYSGSKLTLNKDKSLTLGDSLGTWFKKDSTIKLNYTTSNNDTIELTLDIIECDGYLMLKRQKTALFNGQNTIMENMEYYPVDKIVEIKSSIVKNVGETVSTDIVEFTVNKAELAYYANSPTTSVGTGKTVNVKEACSPSENSGLFSANKGRTLVCLDFTIKNTDRDTLDTDKNIVSFKVNQNGKSSSVRGYDLNNPDGSPFGLDWFRSPISINGDDFITNDTSNILIRSGDTVRAKIVGIAVFEADDLKAPFELVVSLKNSNNEEEKFIFDIK